MNMNKAFFILPLIILALLSAIWSGWLRMGWSLPFTATAAQHGGLMVNSFLASLIFLERAVTFKNKWVLLLPLVNALSGIAFLFHQPRAGQVILCMGGAGFLALCFYFIYRYRELYYYVFLAGAFCLMAGDLILASTQNYVRAVPWWMGFLFFTIVAERLELSRFLALTKFKTNLLIATLILVLTALCWPWFDSGRLLFACGLALASIWLLQYDMARYAARAKGQHRYSGILLLTGYAWLLLSAGILPFQSRLPFGYDAVLHSFFIGFVFSMIFSHAPIILPAVTRWPVKIYRPSLYIWFVIMQLGLVLRIIADGLGDVWCRKIGGMISGLAMLLFFISIAFILHTEQSKAT